MQAAGDIAFGIAAAAANLIRQPIVAVALEQILDRRR
jgi:hypothetical protein